MVNIIKVVLVLVVFHESLDDQFVLGLVKHFVVLLVSGEVHCRVGRLHSEKLDGIRSFVAGGTFAVEHVQHSMSGFIMSIQGSQDLQKELHLSSAAIAKNRVFLVDNPRGLTAHLGG